MNAEQKQRAQNALWFWQGSKNDHEAQLAGGKMAALLQELIDAPEVEPALVVEVEPDYWSGGHYCEGSKPHISPLKVWKLPVGTKLYTAPPAPSVPDGWRIVPYTPTVQMLERAAYAVNNRPQPSKYEPSATPAIIFWTAMLNYAPEAVFINSCSKPPKLSDERILELSDMHMNMYGFDDVAFARAIEREILGGNE